MGYKLFSRIPPKKKKKTRSYQRKLKTNEPNLFKVYNRKENIGSLHSETFTAIFDLAVNFTRAALFLNLNIFFFEIDLNQCHRNKNVANCFILSTSISSMYSM